MTKRKEDPSSKSDSAKGARPAYLTRRDRERQQQIERIDEQVASGDLVIRKMTPEELEKWGPPKADVSERTKRRRKKPLATPNRGN